MLDRGMSSSLVRPEKVTGETARQHPDHTDPDQHQHDGDHSTSRRAGCDVPVADRRDRHDRPPKRLSITLDTRLDQTQDEATQHHQRARRHEDVAEPVLAGNGAQLLGRAPGAAAPTAERARSGTSPTAGSRPARSPAPARNVADRALERDARRNQRRRPPRSPGSPFPLPASMEASAARRR